MQVYPIHEVVPRIRTELEQNTCVLLHAPPGAGKSTVLPIELLNESWLAGKKMILLEPRRLAARAVAYRLASLLGENAGETVGYRIRFETVISAKTRIEVVTEGVLTRMLQADNALESIGLVLFDEFHERSIHADLALALVRNAQDLLRPDLRILIMSATLDTTSLARVLGDIPTVSSVGRSFPVELEYRNASIDMSDLPGEVVGTVKRALREREGDILVFLPGISEIRKVQARLDEEIASARIFALYGDMSMQDQQAAITYDPTGPRKVVLATSIAETSLTIEGVSIVIDSGLSRVPRYDPRSGLTRLQTIKVTRDAADQRAGRAGRLGPGYCYRLWTAATQHQLIDHRTPEIMEADLTPLMLELAEWGVRDMQQLTWMSIPPIGNQKQANELLTQLEAIDERGITKRGRRMATLPAHPRIAHMLLISEDRSLQPLAADIAALLDERDPLSDSAGADLALRVHELRKWRSGVKVNGIISRFARIEKIAAQWRRILGARQNDDLQQDYNVGVLVAAAFPERIAMRVADSTRYKLANGRSATLMNHDPLATEPWLAIAQLDSGSTDGRIFLAAPIHTEELLSHASEQEVVVWDEEREKVAGYVTKGLGGLIIESKPRHTISDEKRVVVILQEVQEKGLSWIGWSDTHTMWTNRVMSLRKWLPEEEWPDVSESGLRASLDVWLVPFLSSVYRRSELLRLDLIQSLMTLLSWNQQQELAARAPERLQVPSGSYLRLNYFEDGSDPVLEVRLQEVFGWLDTPTINKGLTRVRMQLLSPGYKPVQVTQDLRNFWTTTYHDVRKELRGRYPKHHWPEDPFTAEAVRGAKRRSP